MLVGGGILELAFKDLGEDIPEVVAGILLLPIPDAEVKFDFDRTAL